MLRPFLPALLLCGCVPSARPPPPKPPERARTSPRPPASEPARLEPTEGLAPLAPVPLHVRTLGGHEGGPVLVLISGGPGLAHEYMLPLERLASGALKVVSYDQRGTGDSPVPPGTPLGYREHVADLEALREHLGARQLHLLGHSWGGTLAMMYASAHPDRVASLLLVGPVLQSPPSREALSKSINARFAAVASLGVLPDPMPSDPVEAFRALLPAYFSNPRFPIPEQLRRTRFNPELLREVGASMRGLDQRPQLAPLELPVRILFGDGDLLGHAAAEAARDAFTRAQPKLVYLDACGHFPWFECPDAFYAEASAFLREVTEAPGPAHGAYSSPSR